MISASSFFSLCNRLEQGSFICVRHPLSMLTTRKVAWLALVARVARAQATQAITDLSIFQLLAPCASIAVSSQVRAFDDSTQLGCGTSASELQSCICSQEHVSSSVASNISSVVQSRCGSRASDDQWSASQVLRQYCKTEETITFATPTAHTVTDYITDVDKMDYLAPCAYSALSLAVMYSVCRRSLMNLGNMPATVDD
jgi:hypothetical protein